MGVPYCCDTKVNFLSSLFGVESEPEPSKRLGGHVMNNTITLPQTIIKRLEKISAGSRRTPQAIVKQAVQNQLEYEEWFINLNDNTNEGLRHKKKMIASTQFHPEGNPGPFDTNWIFSLLEQ